MKRSIAVITLLSVLLVTSGIFVPAGWAKSMNVPSTEEMARNNKIKPIDQNEKDCDEGKGERFDIGIVIYANWHENATYVTPSPEGPSYTRWNYQCDYISRFSTRVYVMRKLLPPPKVEVAEASFMIYPKNITGTYALGKSVAADGVKAEPGPCGISGGGDTSIDPNTNNFHLDMTLTALVMPTYRGVPMVTITPFMATLEPDASIEIARMGPQQKIIQSPLFTEKFNRAFFKAPIRIEGLSIDRLKKGPVTVDIADSKSGPGLMGKAPNTGGSMTCSFNIRASVYLKRPQDDGYVPSQGDGWYGSEEPPQGGEGDGGPGTVKGPQPPNREAPKDAKPGKGQAPGLTGNPPETDRVKDVKSKARRMLDRALRDMNLINKNSSNFLGKDYTGLNERMRIDLISLFIRAGTREWVTISKSPEYYAGKLTAFYNSHRNLETQPFLDVLLTLIIMEYDWTEEGIDKEALAREYLGDSVYKANKYKSQKK